MTFEQPENMRTSRTPKLIFQKLRAFCYKSMQRMCPATHLNCQKVKSLESVEMIVIKMRVSLNMAITTKNLIMIYTANDYKDQESEIVDRDDTRSVSHVDDIWARN